MADQSSNNDRIVEFGGFEVIYVSGERGQPIPAAFDALEARLPTLKKKRFYGVVIDGGAALSRQSPPRHSGPKQSPKAADRGCAYPRRRQRRRIGEPVRAAALRLLAPVI
jgi:hypothetical protein